MSKVVIDIETNGQDFDSLEPSIQDYLLKNAASDEEKKLIREQTGLSPLTGEIITIGMLNPDTGRGHVLFQDAGTRVATWEEDDIVFQSGSEEQILKIFWDEVAAYSQVITFNGRGFDAPYLILRSAVRGVAVTKNLMPPRFQSYEHLDLLEQLTFFSATRRYNLDMYCKAFGIPTPKDGGLEGKEVSAAYAAGRYVDIAKYNARDIVATAALYKKLQLVMK